MMRKLSLRGVAVVIVLSTFAFGFLWFSGLRLLEEDFWQEITPESSYNIGLGHWRKEWIGKPISEVIKVFGKPDSTYKSGKQTTLWYHKKHYQFIAKDDKITKAYDRTKLDKKIKEASLNQWMIER